ncbi:MAG: Holliday junction branch migration protein RuvA [Planctomycetota bacterium]
MYDYLRGRVASKHLQELSIEVQGVGYALEAPLSTTEVLREGQDVQVWVHHHVREDAHKLFAFATPEERRLFRLLQKVNGVGPGVALGMLSRARVDDICAAIAAERIDILKSLKGVGPKTAQRLVTELKDVVGALAPASGPAPEASGSTAIGEDAIQALEVLGCPPKAARDAVARVLAAGEALPLETVVRRALKTVWPA